jgi:hypothetical protein
MKYTDIELRPHREFGRLLDWCNEYRAALICDETLSFLFRGPTFSFSEANCGRLPHFILVGKFTGIGGALLATNAATMLFGVRDAPRARSHDGDLSEYIQWVTNSTSTRCEHFVLQRSTAVLQWVLSNDCVARTNHMTNSIPELFGSFGLPSPNGIGFSWQFCSAAVARLGKSPLGREVISRLSYTNKMYFYLDSTPEKVRIMIEALKATDSDQIDTAAKAIREKA